MFTVSICANSASSEPVVAQGTSHVKVCSPGELGCALIHVGSRGYQTKTSTSAGSKSLTGAFPCFLGVCVCVFTVSILYRFSKQRANRHSRYVSCESVQSW